jgi:large repetitive protein
MAVITPPVVATPVSSGGLGGFHQVVTAPLPNFTPGHYTIVPVGVELKGSLTGAVYSETITADGGTSPFTFALTSGALPTGTTLNSTSGVISGTTTVAGTYSFTITITDSSGFTGSQAFSIIVAAPSGGGSYAFIS